MAGGLDRRQRERFRKGRMLIDGRLDLHGHTQAQAHDELLAFLRASRAKGARCILVITGKGMTSGKGGVLRHSVPRWLSEPAFRTMVLAFDQAQMKDGGEGALYILLKRVK
jgi:DNA-nicking Smr family endonuclease